MCHDFYIYHLELWHHFVTILSLLHRPVSLTLFLDLAANSNNYYTALEYEKAATTTPE